jgi:hypothetical protein
MPRPGTPSRHTRSFAGYKQNTGRGEGLIYNIPSAYFQMRSKNPDVRVQDATGKRVVTKARSSGNMRDDNSRENLD